MRRSAAWTPPTIQRLRPADIRVARSLNALFGDAFGDPHTCGTEPPDDVHLGELLAKEHVIVLAALTDGELSGGLVAYELEKLERSRREIHIYDLAARSGQRRRSIATSLIAALREIAVHRDAWAIFVQVDHGDDAAIALYGKLGRREDVLHFDIDPTA